MAKRTTLLLLGVAFLPALSAAALPETSATIAASPRPPATNGVIAFRGDRQGQADLFTVAPPGGAEVRLVETPEFHELDPAWSPEGSRIAYVGRGRPGSSPDLFVANEQALGRVRLTQTPVAERDPAWSPDGTRIAYSARTSPSGPTRLFVVGADGTRRRQLTSQAAGTYDASPAWSPDGTQIAFTSDRDGGLPEIYVMNADGGGLRRLTSNDLVDADPTWSPDGTRVAFTQCCATSSEIYVMNADGSGAANLTNTPSVEESDPAWSPDGAAIAYVGFPSAGGGADIFTMTADGSVQTRLTSQAGHDLAPSWRPVPVCTISGTIDADRIDGTDGPDVICAGGGDDTVRAGGGFDLVYGGPGNDVLIGQGGDDLLFGESGDDTLRGSTGFDGLFGGPGLNGCEDSPRGAFRSLCI